jgi:hypothetical protein
VGFYDVHADCVSGLFSRRTRVADVSAALRRARACYPRQRLVVSMDNLHNVHDHPRFLEDQPLVRPDGVWRRTAAEEGEET